MLTRVPRLQQERLLANMLEFVPYVETIYKLINFFTSHPVEF
jgi:hypothetical protein